MTYEEFQKELLNSLECRNIRKVRPQLTERLINNGQRKIGIIFEKAGSKYSPAIYLEDYYEQYQKEGDLENIVEEILKFYSMLPPINIDETSSFQYLKRRITMQLINTEKNHVLLNQVPHIPFEDLSIVYRCFFEVTTSGTVSALINNDMAKMWGADTAVLHKCALENYTRLLPIEFSTMLQCLTCILRPCIKNGTDTDEIYPIIPDDASDDPMYVLTNKMHQWGAALMTCKSLMDEIADFFKEDFYILPSSIHEVILVPESKALMKEEFDHMIQEINQPQVEPQEYLSDHAYHYSQSGKNSIPCFGQDISLAQAGHMI